jgi:hypothetical protein
VYIFNSIQQYRTKDGRELVVPFQQLPSANEYPDYYEKIRNPIDLTIIHNRINADHYRDVPTFLADMRLVCHNAELYNEHGSRIQLDCIIIRRLLCKYSKEAARMGSSGSLTEDGRSMLDGGQMPIASHSGNKNALTPSESHVDRSSSTHNKLRWICETICTMRSPDGPRLSDAIFRLPQRKDAPEYHMLLAQPLDLLTITTRASQTYYKTLDAFVSDVMIFIENNAVYHSGKAIQANIASLAQVCLTLSYTVVRCVFSSIFLFCRRSNRN